MKSDTSPDMAEFQRFFAQHLNAMEQNIGDFATANDVFCSDFKKSLDQELERRSRELGRLSLSLSKIVDGQSQVRSFLITNLKSIIYSSCVKMSELEFHHSLRAVLPK